MGIWYRVGTVAVANGSTTVTGTLTGWFNQARVGDRFTCNGGATWYEIESVASNTSLTLTTAYAGSTASGLAYAIDRSSPKWSAPSDLMIALEAVRNSATHILYGTTAPANTLGVDGDLYLDTAAKVLYGPKAAGAWPGGASLQGPQGSAASIAVHSVTALPPGSTPTVTNVGTASAAQLDFGIPQGLQGVAGSTGAPGGALVVSEPLITRLRGGQDAGILILGDSLGYDTCTPGGTAIFDPAHCWPRLIAAALASAYPSHKVIHRNWNVSTGTAYAADVVVADPGGTPPQLIVWDVSVPGSCDTYTMGSRWAAAVAAASPHLIITNYGQNYASALEFPWRWRILLADLRRQFPDCPIMTLLQTWGTNGATLKKQIRSLQRGIAAEFDCGIYDYGEYIESVGSNASTTWLGDGTHLSVTAQSSVASDMFARRFQYIVGTSIPVPTGRSPWTEGARNYLPDADFTLGLDATSTLNNRWRASVGSPSMAVDTSVYETAKAGVGQSVRLDSAGSAEHEIAINISPIPPELRGKTVTFAVRMYRPDANAAVNRNGLRLSDGVGMDVATAENAYAGDLVDGWVWRAVTAKVGVTATALLCRINAAFTGSSAAGKVWVDRAGLYEGTFAHDPAAAVPDTTAASNLPAVAMQAYAVNLFQDGGRFVASSDNLNITIGAFVAPGYWTLVNSSTLTSHGKFIHNNNDYGGSGGTMDADVKALVDKIRGASYRRYGIEYHVARLTKGSGTVTAYTVSGTTYYNTLYSRQAPRLATSTTVLYVRAKTGNAVFRWYGQTFFVDGVQQAAADLVITPAMGWVHLRIVDAIDPYSAFGYTPASIEIYQAATSDICLLACPCLVPGKIAIDRNAGIVPAYNLWSA